MLTLLLASTILLSSVKVDSCLISAGPPTVASDSSFRAENADGQPLWGGRLFLNGELAFGTGVYREFDYSSQVGNLAAIDSGSAMLCYAALSLGARHHDLLIFSSFTLIEPASTYPIMKYREFNHLDLGLGFEFARRRRLSFSPHTGYGWFKERMWAFRLGGPDLGSASMAYHGAEVGVDLKCKVSGNVRIRSLNSIYISSPLCSKAAITIERVLPLNGSDGKYHIGLGFDAFFYDKKVRYLMASLLCGF